MFSPNLVLLLATLAALMCAPLLYAAARPRPKVLAALDGFVLVTIAGLVIIEVMPEALESGGAWSLGFLALGALGPTVFESLLHRAQREAHVAALLLAVAGLVVHSVGDGTALAPQAGEPHLALALAIVIHSVPVGLVVWWLIYPVFGALLPALAIGAMCLGTVVGYTFSDELSALLGARGWAWFQALVAGSILHVVFGRPHLHDGSEHHAAQPPYEGLGNIAGLVALFLLEQLHLGSHSVHPFFGRLLELSLESAPALLLAYAAGGLIGAELPDRWLGWLGRGGPGMQALRGTALGLPLPICSCGVLPLYRSLRLRGAPMAAAIAFLIATPEVGLTGLFVSLPLLGWQMTLLRVLSAAALAIFAGWALARLFTRANEPRFQFTAAPAASPLSAPASVPTTAASCCGHDHHGHGHDHGDHPHTHAAAPRTRLGRWVRTAFVELVDGTASWILLGLIVAAAMAPYVEAASWAQLPDVWEVLLFALLGMPVYVCAAGATPMVAVFIASGVSPGAAIAFLLTGPATNIATVGMLRGLHGIRFAAAFALLTGFGAVTLGWAVNLLAPALPTQVLPTAHTHGWVETLSLAVLILLFLGSLLRRGGRSFFGELLDSLRITQAGACH